MTGKAGVFNNSAQQQTYLADNNNQFVLRDFSNKANHVAFVGDVSLLGRVQLCECWNLVGGYNVMWISGIARAPEQLDFTDTPGSGSGIVTNGNAFLHGVSFGIEGRW